MRFDGLDKPLAVVLGGSGAVGAVALQSILSSSVGYEVIAPTRLELDLMNEFELAHLPSKSLDIIVLSVGSYGGLKGYVSHNPETYSHDFYLNQKRFCEKFLRKNGLIINVSSAALENQANYLPTSKYHGYCSEKLIMERALASIRDAYVVNLRPTNILSPYEKFTSSQHVFASMYRKLIECDDYCDIWTSLEDWREFTTSDLLGACFEEIINSFRKRGLPSRHLNVAVGSGVQTLIMDLARSICIALDKRNVKLNATQPRRDGPVGTVVGTSQMEVISSSFEAPPFSLQSTVDDLVGVYSVKGCKKC